MSEEQWPTPFLLAGVNAIFKLKPAFMTVTDYIHILRVYFPPDGLSSPVPTAASKAPWTQFVNAKAKEQELRAEISRLKAEVSRLTDEDATRADERDKGKKASDALKAGSIKGKKKKTPTVDKLLGEAWASLEETSAALSGSISGSANAGTKSFIRHMYHLNKVLTQDNPLAGELAEALILALDSAKKLLPLRVDGNGSEGRSSHTRLANMRQEDMDRACHSLNLTMIMVSKGFFRLPNCETGADHNLEKLTGVVVHSLLSFFGFLRRRLNMRIGELIRGNTSGQGQTKVSSGRARPVRQADSTRQEILCGNITSLLAMFVRVFLLGIPKGAEVFQKSGKTNSAQERLVEGVLYLLLTRSGGLLHMITFDEKDQSNADRGGAVPELPSDEELRAARMEAKFLSPLIRYILKSPFAAHDSNKKDSQSATLKAKLQATLMHGCFGSGRGTEHLAEPLELGLARQDYSQLLEEAESKNKEHEDGPWWFMNEMWEVVGWELLVPRSIYDE